MTISIVMPVLNGMPWLPEAVGSVLAQTPDATPELIIRDGGSTDGSREWVREHATRAKPTFQPDDGQTDALTKWFAVATGEILGWLNADDVLEPDALRVVGRAFESRPDAVAVSGACLLVDAGGAVTGEVRRVRDATLRGLMSTNINLPQPATFFRRSAYEAVGGLDPSLRFAMDVDLWLRLAATGPIVLLPETLARFRVHERAKTQVAELATLREDWSVRRRHGMALLGRTSRTMLKQMYLHPAKQRLASRMTPPAG